MSPESHPSKSSGTPGRPNSKRLCALLPRNILDLEADPADQAGSALVQLDYTEPERHVRSR